MTPRKVVSAFVEAFNKAEAQTLASLYSETGINHKFRNRLLKDEQQFRKYMKHLPSALLIVVTAMLIMLPQTSMADFFKYKDNKGNLIITNRFEDVPKKYRNRVIVVWDKDLEAKDPVARRSAAALEQYEQQEANKKALQQAEEKKTSTKKSKTLVIELDENTGQLIRRFE